MSIYEQNGYPSRADYLDQMAADYGVSEEAVHALAGMLGESEDFDGLIAALNDYNELELI